MRRIWLGVWGVLLLAGACALDDSGTEGAGAASLVGAGSVEEIGLLVFLNDAATTFEVLDVDVALDRRAAEGLIAGRPFASASEIDAVPYVGPEAMSRLLAWASAEGFLEVGAAERERAILALVNDAGIALEVLDVDVALDVRAARGIVAGRPFASLAAVDAVAYVGPAALDALAVYAFANGYGDVAGGGGGGRDMPCAVISEYAEGQGNNNKAIEIWNCGSSPIALETLGVCLVRNDDTTCSNRATVGAGELAPGEVWVACRTQDGTFNDPFANLAAACDQAIGGAATFDGDDRILLFHDADGDTVLDADEAVLDSFGDPAVRPLVTLWADVVLRRCDVTPHAPGPFFAPDYFAAHARHDYTHFGVPPTAGCGRTLGAAGDDCASADECAPGLRCYGRPNDGSGMVGKCVDPAPVYGEGERCDRFAPCNDGLICAGTTLWGEGTCNPQWMAGRFEQHAPVVIPDDSSMSATSSVVVYGLASVPVDLDVQVELGHPRPMDLRVTLIDPNGAEAVLWDRDAGLGTHGRSFVTSGGISRDDQVNGRWTLRVDDLVGGESGYVLRWSLFVVSRWD